MQHFNIGKKVEINPFEKVKYIHIAGCTLYKFKQYLDKVSDNVDTKKIEGEWTVLYGIEKLDFTTIVKWFAPYRGTFYFQGTTIHFAINRDILACW